MAYDKIKIFEQSKSVIKKHRLYFIEDVVAYLPIVKKTFYEYFPLESNESNILKELLEQNKINTKVQIRKKLLKGERAPELIALYKLICTDEERRSLSMQEIKHSGGITTPITGMQLIKDDTQDKITAKTI
jgi:hypothetical protein